MPLSFLLDEHLRGVLPQAIRHHNAAGAYVIDALCVGDPPDLPLGSVDPDILIWAERNGRILVSQDKTTMPGHFAAHLGAGRHSPGVLILRTGFSLADIILALAMAAHAGFAADYLDQVKRIP
jgi:hypothetical protein